MLEVNDGVFCTHLKEVCTDCGVDVRQENDSFYGLDLIDREGIECPASTQNKEGGYQCKKHGSTGCNRCYGWKKQITRARNAAKKAGKKYTAPARRHRLRSSYHPWTLRRNRGLRIT